MQALTFNRERHEYTVDGRIIPSVSEIMRPLTDSYYSKASLKAIEKAKKRGTAVHEAIDDYLLFGVTNKRYEPYIKAYEAFQARWPMKLVGNELMLTNGKYAGTVDLLFVDAFGFFHLVDMKVTYKINADLLAVQLEAYKRLCEHNGLPVKECHVLWFKTKDKKVEYEYKPITPNPTTWNSLCFTNPKVAK
jgi:hypothetical protein